MCGGEKSREKKKKKGIIWMIEIKKGKVKFKNATTIFSQ